MHDSKTPTPNIEKRLLDVLPNSKFGTFFQKAYSGPLPLYLLALDPGETTGFCYLKTSADPAIKEPQLLVGQIKTGDFPGVVDNYMELVMNNWPYSKLIMEDYRIYSWKSDDHKWSSVHTLRVIGAIQALQRWEWSHIPIEFHSAQEGKSFVTDTKLNEWGLYDQTKGLKHARDAMRHAIHHAVFKLKSA